MSTVLDTLVTKFTFETDKSGIDKAERSLGDFKNKAIGIAASIGAFLGGGFLLNQVAESADETIKWADANNMAVQTLGELEFAVQRQGGTINGLRTSLTSVNRAIGEVSRGIGRAKLAFEAYGLSIRKSDGSLKNAAEMLVDLNERFVTLKTAEQFDFGMKMGFDKGTILLLQTAPEIVADLRKEAAKLGVLTRQDAVNAAIFVDGMTNVTQAVLSLKHEIGGIFFKPIADLLFEIANGITFMRENKSFFIILLGLLGAITAAYYRMAIASAIAWAISLGPLLVIPTLIASVVAGLALLIDDFIAFFKGNESAVGDLVKKWPWLGKAIYAVRDAAVMMFDNMIQGFIGLWAWIKKLSAGIIEFLFNPLDSVTNLMKKLPGIWGKISSFFGEPAFQVNSQSARPLGGISPDNPILTMSNRSVSRNTELKIAAVNIDARGGDSQEIAENVGSELGSQLKNTVEDFDSRIDK